MPRPTQKKSQPGARRKTEAARQSPGRSPPELRRKRPLAVMPKTGPGSSTQNPPTTEEDRHAHRWTFLTNHTHVLVLIKAQPELILREVSRQVGITERAVQRIIQDLETAGFILRHKVGRQNHYEVLTEKPLRHPIEAHRTIGDLLRLING